MEWELMSDAEVVLWFAEPIKGSDVIPHNMELGFRRMLGILARTSIHPVKLESLYGLTDGLPG